MTTIVETPRLIATTVTSSGALAAGHHTPVNASSGARTMTLPTTVTPGAHLSVEKIDSSSNPVAVTGSIRGTSGSVSLVLQYESVTFVADSTGNSWWPTAGHKTKTSLDNLYVARPGSTAAVGSVPTKQSDGTVAYAVPISPGVFFPEDSGAAGNGTTDDTAAVQAAITAAQNYTTSNPGQYGVVAFRSIYKISSTITATAQIGIVGVATDGCGLLTSGSGFTGTTVLSVAPASQAPVALDSFSITDSSATRTLLALSNVVRGQVTGLDLSGGQDQILFNNVNDSRVAGNMLRNGINAYAFRTTTSTHVQFHNNRVRDATYVYFLASSGIVTSLTYTGDDIINGGSGANVTNSYPWLAAAQANTPKSGTTFHSGSSANSAVIFLEPNVGKKTHVRRGQFALEFLNDAFTTVIASLDNGGQLVLNDSLKLTTATIPTAAASEAGSVRYKAGAAGVADTIQVCLKSSADTYSWKTIATG